MTSHSPSSLATSIHTASVTLPFVLSQLHFKFLHTMQSFKGTIPRTTKFRATVSCNRSMQPFPCNHSIIPFHATVPCNYSIQRYTWHDHSMCSLYKTIACNITQPFHATIPCNITRNTTIQCNLWIKLFQASQSFRAIFHATIPCSHSMKPSSVTVPWNHSRPFLIQHPFPSTILCSSTTPINHSMKAFHTSQSFHATISCSHSVHHFTTLFPVSVPCNQCIQPYHATNRCNHSKQPFCAADHATIPSNRSMQTATDSFQCNCSGNIPVQSHAISHATIRSLQPFYAKISYNSSRQPFHTTFHATNPRNHATNPRNCSIATLPCNNSMQPFHETILGKYCRLGQIVLTETTYASAYVLYVAINGSPDRNYMLHSNYNIPGGTHYKVLKAGNLSREEVLDIIYRYAKNVKRS